MKQEETLVAVFKIVENGQIICVVRSVKLTGSTTRGAAIQLIVSTVKKDYNTSNVEFQFWADKCVAMGGQPIVVR